MDVDVAVVGGGPAGCTAAIAASAHGHSVAVVAESGVRQDRIPEVAGPALKELLDANGSASALSGLEPCFGVSANWGGRENYQPSILNPLGTSWLVQRDQFDGLLGSAARAMGVKWIDARARDASVDASGVTVSVVGTGSVRAKWLVIATGSSAWPSRIAGQVSETYDRLIAYHALLMAPLRERMLFVESARNGWWYMCPADKDRTAVCFVTDPKTARMLGASTAVRWNELFRCTNLSKRFGSKPSPTRIIGSSAAVTALSNAAGFRWIAVGDAAAKFDPIGGSGLCLGLDGGKRAASAVSHALRGDMTAIDGYITRMRRLTAAYVRQRQDHYSIEASRRSDPFWQDRISRDLEVASSCCF